MFIFNIIEIKIYFGIGIKNIIILMKILWVFKIFFYDNFNCSYLFLIKFM